jgi:uncharacterized protein involved in exopolysaccharide biosynthesis
MSSTTYEDAGASDRMDRAGQSAGTERDVRSMHQVGELPAFSFQMLKSIVRRRSRLIATIVAGGTALAVLVGILVPPKYTAKAEIVVVKPPLVGGQVTVAQSSDQAAVEIDTHVATLTSRAHLQRVLESLSYAAQAAARNGRTEPGAPANGLPEDAQSRPTAADLTASEWLSLNELGRRLHVWIGALTKSGDGTALNLDELERHLKVEQERRSHVIAVKFTSASPEEATAVTNRTAQLYVDSENVEKRNSRSLDPTDFRGDYASLWTEFAKEHVHVSRIKTELGDKDTLDQNLLRDVPLPRAEISEIVGTEAELLKARQADHRSQKAFLQRALKLADEQIAALSVQEQKEEQGAQADAEELQRVTELFGRGVLPSPRVTDARRAVLLSSTRKLQTTAELMRVKRQRDDVLKDLERLDEQRKITLLRELQDTSLKLSQIRPKLQTSAPDVRILSLASLPDRPSSPNPILFIPAALVLSSICGVMIAVVSAFGSFDLSRTHGDRASVDVVPGRVVDTIAGPQVTTTASHHAPDNNAARLVNVPMETTLRKTG